MEQPAVSCPLAIKCELLFELMSTVAARLGRLEMAAQNPDAADAYRKRRHAVLVARREINPNDEDAVSALLNEYDQYAAALAQELLAQEGGAKRSA